MVFCYFQGVHKEISNMKKVKGNFVTNQKSKCANIPLINTCSKFIYGWSCSSVFITILIPFYFVNLFHTEPSRHLLLKVINRNSRTRFEICSKLTIRTPERCHWRPLDVFIVNFEHISHLVLVVLLLTLNNCLLGRRNSRIIVCERHLWSFQTKFRDIGF